MSRAGIEAGEKMRPGRLMAGMAIFFIAFHGALYLLGIRFATYPAEAFLHLLDTTLLKSRLLESCFYLHIQPPLFNLLIGLGVKCFPGGSLQGFYPAYLGLGLGLYWATFFAMRGVGISMLTALVLSTLFMVSPSFILFEHWLFYTLPCTFLLTVSVLFLADILKKGRAWSIAGFFACNVLLCGTWSLFHLSYLVVTAVALIACCREQWKKIGVCGAVALLLVGGLYAKNYALFGTFGASSFMGRNLWIMSVGNLRWEDRERLIVEGKLSDVSRVNRWNTLKYYPERFQNIAGFEGIPALRQVDKVNGAHNFNHIAHLAISKQYMADAVAGLRFSPKAFLLANTVAWYNYFRPAASYGITPENFKRLRGWITFCDYAVYGKVPGKTASSLYWARVSNSPPYAFLLVGVPALAAYGAWIMLRGRAGARVLGKNDRVIIAYLLFNIAYVAVLGSLLDFGETNRYRFTTEPMNLVLLAIVVQDVLVARFRNGRAREHVAE